MENDGYRTFYTVGKRWLSHLVGSDGCRTRSMVIYGKICAKQTATGCEFIVSIPSKFTMGCLGSGKCTMGCTYGIGYGYMRVHNFM